MSSILRLNGRANLITVDRLDHSAGHLLMCWGASKVRAPDITALVARVNEGVCPIEAIVFCSAHSASIQQWIRAVGRPGARELVPWPPALTGAA